MRAPSSVLLLPIIQGKSDGFFNAVIRLGQQTRCETSPDVWVLRLKTVGSSFGADAATPGKLVRFSIVLQSAELFATGIVEV